MGDELAGQRMDEDGAKARMHVLKSQAVRQSMVEVMAEQRVEIVRRAKAKLVAMGVNVEEADLEPQIS